jgi:4'-phosphopantetheinyl transferase
MHKPSRPRRTGAARVSLCVAHLQDIALTDALQVISAAERKRAAGINHREAREQFVRTRALLRLLLAERIGQAPGNLVLEDESGEAPRLAGNVWQLHFNVSHSYDWAALAVADFPIGIDIERVDTGQDWDGIADIMFHPEEREQFRQAHPDQRTFGFFATWTRKEAYLKAIGAGLRLDPPSFSTASPDGAVATTLPTTPEGWFTISVDSPAGYALALAVPGPEFAEGCSAGRLVDRVELTELFRYTQPVWPLCASADIPSRRIVLS